MEANTTQQSNRERGNGNNKNPWEMVEDDDDDIMRNIQQHFFEGVGGIVNTTIKQSKY